MIISRTETSNTLRMRRDRARERAKRTGDETFNRDARRLDLELVRREIDSGRIF